MLSRKKKDGGHLAENKTVETPSANPRRRRRKKRGLSPLLVIVPAVILVAVSYFLFRMTRSTADFRLPKAAEQIYAGQTFHVKKGSVISVDRDGEARLIREITKSTLNSIPIYYEGEESIVTAHKYSYIDPRNGKEVSISRLTEITADGNGGVKLTHEGKEVQAYNGFLYDGGNLYIFLEPVTLTFNGYSFHLGRMSYVEADYRNNIMVYDRGTGETFMEPATTAVTAITDAEDYSVSLLGASYTDTEGNKILLINDAEILDPLI